MSENEGDMPEVAAPVPEVKEDKAREIPSPVVFFGSDEEYDYLDLRAVPVEKDRPEPEVEVELESTDPKDSSAQESADTSDSTEKPPEGDAPVEKDSTPSKENESGQQASSSPTPAGKSKQTVET